MNHQIQREESPRAYQDESSYGYQARGDAETEYYPYEEWRQKASDIQPASTHLPTSGQRLALAIVSVAAMAPLVVLLLQSAISDENAGNLLILLTRLAALLLVCLTIVWINIVFNRRR